MRRTATPAVVIALLLALLLALTGCGGEEKKGTSIGQLGEEPETPSVTPSSGSSAEASPDATPFDDKGSEILRGTVKGATTPEAEAVVDAWFAYWDVRASSFGLAKVSPELGSVAAADAVEDVVRYVAYLRSKKLHTVGDTRLGVSNLKVDGKSATLTSCGVNKSIDKTAEGRPAEEFTPFFTIDGTLTQVGGTWVVVETKVTQRTPCQA